MMDEMIKTVKAAFEPNADAATRQQAATILRGLLVMLEPQGAPPPPSPSAPPSGAGGIGTLLDLILERLRPHLPTDEAAAMPRFSVPIVKVR